MTFKDGSTVLGTGTLTDGTASLSISKFSVGTHSITIVYGGDSNFQSSGSTVLKQLVNTSASPSVLESTVHPVDLALGDLPDKTDTRSLIELLALEQLTVHGNSTKVSTRRL